MAEKLPDPPQTANGEYFDASLRHQIGIRRLASSEANGVLKILEKSDAELVLLLRSKLGGIRRPINFTSKRWLGLLASIREMRAEAVGQMKFALKDNLVELASLEAAFEVQMLQAALPVTVSMKTVPKQTLRALVTSKPFSGGPDASRTLNQWWTGLKKTDQVRTVEAIQLGVTQGETIDQIAKRIGGTRAQGFSDGVLAVNRRNAQAIARTGVNHVSNAAREQVWIENEDIMAGFKWVSTLDGRTSAICRARDGHVVAVSGKESMIPASIPRLQPPGARPPAHPNCRSVMVGFIDGEDFGNAVGNRPFVRDTKTPAGRTIDQRAKAKSKAGDAKWKRMTPKQRNSAIKVEREAWGQRVVGTVPNDVSYNTWLKRQPVGFQDDVLGATKGKLFREGGLSMDKFVDRTGQELNLSQLSDQDPTAFMKAGLDPDDF